jgi:hypothetical protein
MLNIAITVAKIKNVGAPVNGRIPQKRWNILPSGNSHVKK